MKFSTVYYEPNSLAYSLGEQLRETFKDPPWIPIDSHNSIKEMQEKPNSEFGKVKYNLIVGIRKTHKHAESQKVSDYLVPCTFSGCTAMCLYCYLICNYNKCAYLRLFVNWEQILGRIIERGQKSGTPLAFEIGSNSDLALENTITGNPFYAILCSTREGTGSITLPTKFHAADPLPDLPHQGKAIFRMSVNPQPIVNRIELGTSSLSKQIEVVNRMCEAGYPYGLLAAPVTLAGNWRIPYTGLLEELQDDLTEKAKNRVFLEIILMTYSYIRRVINNETFPNAPELYDTEQMTERGHGRYCYRSEVKAEAETYFRGEIKWVLDGIHILHIDRHFSSSIPQETGPPSGVYPI